MMLGYSLLPGNKENYSGKSLTEQGQTFLLSGTYRHVLPNIFDLLSFPYVAKKPPSGGLN